MMLRLLVLLVALGFAITAAHAAGRVALVVGNGAYVHSSALANPANDATVIAGSLRQVGFEVVEVTDGTHRRLLDALSEFGRKAQGSDVALFFYAGHGLEVSGRNWILPVDADIQASSDLPAAAVKVDDVLELMELSEARVRLVILDACRNNPLPRSLTRASTRGLAKIDASAAGTMIVFSAAPGEVALDGSGLNSPFSEALAKHIGQPGLEVRQMMGRVRQDVLAATGNKQVPWVNEAIVGDYFIAGEVPAANPPPAQPIAPPVAGQSNDALSVELAFWNSVQDSGSRDMLDLYLKKYPNGAFRDLAEVKIAALDKTQQSLPRTAPLPALGVVPQAADQLRAMEAQARALVERFNTTFSGPMEQALADLPTIYAEGVDFYGKYFSLADIADDKRKLMERWPERYYSAPGEQVSVFCNVGTRSCDVSAIVSWQVSSAARGKSAQGVSQTDLRIDFTASGPRVVYENSQAVARN